MQKREYHSSATATEPEGWGDHGTYTRELQFLPMPCTFSIKDGKNPVGAFSILVNLQMGCDRCILPSLEGKQWGRPHQRCPNPPRWDRSSGVSIIQRSWGCLGEPWHFHQTGVEYKDTWQISVDRDDLCFPRKQSRGNASEARVSSCFWWPLSPSWRWPL